MVNTLEGLNNLKVYIISLENIIKSGLLNTKN